MSAPLPRPVLPSGTQAPFSVIVRKKLMTPRDFWELVKRIVP